MLPDKQMGMYGMHTIYVGIWYNIQHMSTLTFGPALSVAAVDKLNFCAALFVALRQFAFWLCNISPFQTLHAASCDFQFN